METNKICPQCGERAGPNGLDDLCPQCMMKVGIDSCTNSATGRPVRGFVPPAVERLAGLFPPLEVLEVVGQGGMGAVYKARQRDLDRLVALKILPDRAGSDPGFAERFTREARALARLSHPNIVTVHDFGRVQNLHYFIMEYVDGANLRQVERSGGLEPRQALAIIPQICEALQFAHDKGIVHRDIKPENILIDLEGHVKIADFGLAKILGQSQDQTLTQEGHMMGTPHYMAPEQVEHPQAVDHRADIYSLGVVFYEMLTGELPLGKFAPPSSKVQIDVRLDEVVLRTLEKEPDRRYQQAGQVKTAVETIAHAPSEAQQRILRDVVGLVEIRRRIRGPAIGLMATAVLQAVVALALTLFAIPAVGREGGDPGGHAAIGSMIVLSLVAAVVVLIGAIQMLRLSRYTLVRVAIAVAVIGGPAAVVGLPFGIWAWIVMSRRGIKEAFETARTVRYASPGTEAAGPLRFSR